ncbi:MAG: helix-turn-helix domain-containing protein [Anaerolineales bacterium]|nr:helix-turn-helix domain-containing protein [Anaerolineales bacterium]
MEKDFVTPHEVVEELNMTQYAIRVWVRSGKLPASRLLDRWIIARSDYEAFKADYQKWARAE